MPEWLTNLGGIVDVAGKIFGTGYNMYTNQRDFDYQRSLQQQIFEREDTAVQRRMHDLQVAGLNPNLAAGSAAQAGGVVSRSNTNDLNIGSILDTINAQKQIKRQEVETENAKIEQGILNNQKAVSDYEKGLKKLESDYNSMLIYHKLGFHVVPTTDGYVLKSDAFGFPIDDNNDYIKEYPFLNEYDENLKSLKNSNKYLENELRFQTADHISDYINTGSSVVGNILKFKRFH